VQDGKLCLVFHQESRLQLVQRVQHHQRHWQSNRRLRVGGKCLPPFSIFPVFVVPSVSWQSVDLDLKTT
jgi:hypothetical protein